MTLITRFWHVVIDITSWLTMPMGPSQHPLGVPITQLPDDQFRTLGKQHFRPPAGDLKDTNFECDYRAMPDWVSCSTADDRECWLRNSKTGERLDIHTNYEKIAPIGVVRDITLYVTDDSIDADGQIFEDGKVFNSTYPGPWIQACWGDVLNITVYNNMTESKEGTSIHWHGIRQNLSVDMDGVNGVTQCPIAPGDSFSYTFNTTQYGTSWYHSHYSVQYADGLQGPLTIHGPQSAPFDSSKLPVLMTDWSHKAALDVMKNSTLGNWANKTILLNGRGDVTQFSGEDNITYVNTTDMAKRREWHFDATPVGTPGRPRRYLFRLINTSFDTTFVFSIDNHRLKIISADFVPIEPYNGTSVLVGIGQRYNVIVEANPEDENGNLVKHDGNFWIRTWVPKKCGIKPGTDGYEKTGILRYDDKSTVDPKSNPWKDVPMACSDEEYGSLHPILPWTIGPAANAANAGTKVEDPNGEKFDVTLDTSGKTKGFPVAFFSLQRSGTKKFKPLQIDFADPILMHLGDNRTQWPEKWVVIPEDYAETDWIYLVLTMVPGSYGTNAHPIHLHGHDFALLLQKENEPYDPEKHAKELNRKNPPRRDVVLLPTKGFVVIAFKADNPGSWLMHCHIARHAGEGLALQILERQSDANALLPLDSPRMLESQRVCVNWKDWQRDHHLYEGDSGI